MSQYLLIGFFEKLEIPNTYELEQIVEDLLQVPDDKESGFFIECDMLYPAEIKEKTKKLSFVPLSNKSRSRVILRIYEKCKSTEIQTYTEACV